VTTSTSACNCYLAAAVSCNVGSFVIEYSYLFFCWKNRPLCIFGQDIFSKLVIILTANFDCR